jgi:hypothetical protein
MSWRQTVAWLIVLTCHEDSAVEHWRSWKWREKTKLIEKKISRFKVLSSPTVPQYSIDI